MIILQISLVSEESCDDFLMPSSQSELAPSSSALLVTGALQSRRRSPRQAVTILSQPPTPSSKHPIYQPISPRQVLDQPYFPPDPADGAICPPLPGRDLAPPIPPRPPNLWDELTPSKPALTPTPPLSPVRDAPPDLPPKTYLMKPGNAAIHTMEAPPPATPPLDPGAPPLPQRRYLPENEEVQGLKLSIEELDSTGVLSATEPADTLVPTAREEEGTEKNILTAARPNIPLPSSVAAEEGTGPGEVPRTANPLSTVLLPKVCKHSKTAPSDLHMMYIEKTCNCKCKNFLVYELTRKKQICDCCKQKFEIKRRHST